MHLGDEYVADGENEVPRATIANSHLMRGAQPIEHWKAQTIQRHVKPFGRPPAVRMGHDKISVHRALFQIFQVADQNLFGREALQQRELVVVTAPITVAPISTRKEPTLHNKSGSAPMAMRLPPKWKCPSSIASTSWPR